MFFKLKIDTSLVFYLMFESEPSSKSDKFQK